MTTIIQPSVGGRVSGVLGSKPTCIYGEGCLARLVDDLHNSEYIHTKSSLLPKCHDDPDCDMYATARNYIIGGGGGPPTLELKMAQEHVEMTSHSPIYSTLPGLPGVVIGQKHRSRSISVSSTPHLRYYGSQSDETSLDRIVGGRPLPRRAGDIKSAEEEYSQSDGIVTFLSRTGQSPAGAEGRSRKSEIRDSSSADTRSTSSSTPTISPHRDVEVPRLKLPGSPSSGGAWVPITKIAPRSRREDISTSARKHKGKSDPRHVHPHSERVSKSSPGLGDVVSATDGVITIVSTSSRDNPAGGNASTRSEPTPGRDKRRDPKITSARSENGHRTKTELSSGPTYPSSSGSKEIAAKIDRLRRDMNDANTCISTLQNQIAKLMNHIAFLDNRLDVANKETANLRDLLIEYCLV